MNIRFSSLASLFALSFLASSNTYAVFDSDQSCPGAFAWGGNNYICVWRNGVFRTGDSSANEAQCDNPASNYVLIEDTESYGTVYKRYRSVDLCLDENGDNKDPNSGGGDNGGGDNGGGDNGGGDNGGGDNGGGDNGGGDNTGGGDNGGGGGGCITTDPEGCEPEPPSGGGDGGDGTGGDGTGGDGSGGDGTGGDGTGGGGTGGDGTGGDGTGGDGTGGDGTGGDGSGGDGTGGDDGSNSGDNPSACFDYSSCRQIAYQSMQGCLDGDRDIISFYYDSPSNFGADCLSCSGSNANSYSECTDNSCPYGFDSETNKCWSESCPYGDCPDPDSPSSSEEVPPPPEPEKPQDDKVENDQIVPALRDILRELQNDDSATSQDISNQTSKLENAIDNLKQKNADGNAEIIEALTQLKNALEGDNVPESGLDDIIKLLKDLLNGQANQACIASGYTSYNSSLEACEGFKESALEFDNSNLDELPSMIENSGIGRSLQKLSNAGTGVSSQCGGAMIQSFKLKLGDYVNTDLKLNLCNWLEPIQDMLRILGLLFWGLVSLRVIFEA